MLGNAISSLQLLRRQYLQLVEVKSLAIPSTALLRELDVQEWIYANMFDDTSRQRLPAPRYRLRVLKSIAATIEQAIVDPDEDVSQLKSTSISLFHGFLYFNLMRV